MTDVPYSGPERREAGRRSTGTGGTAVERLIALKDSVDKLGDNVGGLTDELGLITELQRKQEKLNKDVSDQNDDNQAWRRKAMVRTVSALLLLTSIIAAIVIIGVVVVKDNRSTSSQFKDYRDQSVANCHVRNAQVRSNIEFYNGLLAILKSTSVSPQLTALDSLVQHQLSEQPTQVDCNQLSGSSAPPAAVH